MAEMISIFAYRVQNPFENMFHSFADWVRANQTRTALNKLSSRELEDIGVERCDIDKIVAGKF